MCCHTTVPGYLPRKEPAFLNTRFWVFASPLSGSAELAPRATVFLLSPLGHHRTADGKCCFSSASFSGNGRRFSWLWRPAEPCHNQPELFLYSLWLVLRKSSMRFFIGKYLLEMWSCTQHLLWYKHWASRLCCLHKNPLHEWLFSLLLRFRQDSHAWGHTFDVSAFEGRSFWLLKPLLCHPSHITSEVIPANSHQAFSTHTAPEGLGLGGPGGRPDTRIL